jgi:hypothetical protein
MAKGTCAYCCFVLAILGMLFYVVLAILARSGNEAFLMVKATGTEPEHKNVTEDNLWIAAGIFGVQMVTCYVIFKF